MDEAPQFIRGSSLPAHICVTIAVECCISLFLPPGLVLASFPLQVREGARLREGKGLTCGHMAGKW